jgi:signal transduction histidine kinase
MTQENENQKNKKNSARKHSRKGDIQQSAEYRVASIALELTALTKELVFQNKEKEARAAELEEMNFNLIVQYDEKEKRANELILANIELMFQSVEKEKRATDLAIIKLKCAQKEARALELERDYNEKEALNRQISHKQKLESIGRLTSGIAHDFNNILASILGYNEMNH